MCYKPKRKYANYISPKKNNYLLMKLYSTRNKNIQIGLKEAVFDGLASDGGLYLLTEIPTFEPDFFKEIHQLSLHEIWLEVAKKWIGNEISTPELEKIIQKVFTFDIPIVNIHDHIFALELFHGPTMAFKDVGARFMANLMSYFQKNENKEINIVVATSGDTGSAVASGFFDVPGINVFILYPSGKVSPLQEKQLTTWGKNITAIEIDGTFDDCQNIVKQLSSNDLIKSQINLSSANSINIARLIPQSFYYFSAYAQLKKFGNSFAFSVPSGNFGNLTAGILAKKMGLPIDFFVAATNSNTVFPDYLASGNFVPKPSIETISNAMDVGNPSNFERLKELYFNLDNLKKDIKSYAFSDKQTRDIIREVATKHDYIMDPHGAVAYLGLQKFMETKKIDVGLFLETAHPAKFKNVIESTLNQNIEIPENLKVFENRPKVSIQSIIDIDNVGQIILSKNKV